MRESCSACVFDIQRFSIHDGPGIRTVVFFKGCTLACVWCQNPEALSAAPEIAYYEERCLDGCDRCLESCTEGALASEKTRRVDFEHCTGCGACSEVCPSEALRLIGRNWEAPDLLWEVCKDRPFFESSGGGITLSGGEPVVRGKFLRGFLPLAKAEGLHVTVETAGAYAFELVPPLLPHVDLWLFDLKLADPERHQLHTGIDNARILENLTRLVQLEAPLEVRMPVIPDRNTDDENVAATSKLLAELGVPSLTLLPYNHLWEAKLPRLSTERCGLEIRPPDDRFYDELRTAFSKQGLEASL